MFGFIRNSSFDRMLDGRMQGHADECYRGQSFVHSNFNRIFGSSEGNWLVPALISICKNTHKIALLADSEADGPRQRNTNLQSAVQLLQDSYSKTFNDRTEYQVSPTHCLLFLVLYLISRSALLAKFAIWYRRVQKSWGFGNCQWVVWDVLQTQHTQAM